MSSKIKILSVILLSFFTLSVKAVNMEGIIKKDPKKGTCLIWKGQTIPIKSDNTLIQEMITKLETGDYIDASGQKWAHSIVIESIRYVGLSRILGQWISQSLEVYNFQSFTELYLTPSSITLNVQPRQKFTYTILPGREDKWSAVFLNDQQAQVGHLVFNANGSVKIEVLNPETGRVQRVIVLVRMLNQDSL